MEKYTEHKFMFERRVNTLPTKMLSAHYHETNELYYLEKGETKYFIGDELYFLDAGDMIFVPKGVLHKTNDEKMGKERTLIIFDDDYPFGECKKYINEMKNNKFIKILPEHMYEIKEILYKIEKENNKKQTGYEEMMRTYLCQLIILISRYRSKEKMRQVSENYMIIQNAAKYISEHLTADLSLRALAKKFALSPSYFSRQFKQTTGFTLGEYINISRVMAAEKLLLSSDKKTIMQISEQCGFNDSNYFAAVFKKIKGITPKKYAMQNSDSLRW